MPEHLPFFAELSQQVQELNAELQQLSSLEMTADLTANQQSALVRHRLEARSRIRRLRDLLSSIEREYGLEPLKIIYLA